MYFQAFILLASLVLYFVINSMPSSNSNKIRRIYIYILMGLCIAQSGLRGLDVGADTLNYYNMFVDIGQTTWNDTMTSLFDHSTYKDPGYILLVKVFYSIIPSFRVFLIFVAFLFFSSLGQLLYKYTDSIIEVLVAVALYQCLFYSFFSITGIRQTIATSFLLFAIPYAFDKKLIRFSLLVIIASTQHLSSLFFLLFYCLTYISWPRVYILFSVLFYFIVSIIGSSLSAILSNTFFDQYAHFLEQSDYAVSVVFKLFIWVIVLLLYIRMDKVCTRKSYMCVFSNAIASALFLLPLIDLNPSNMRIVQYFSICCLLALPKLCMSFNQRKYSEGVSLMCFVLLTIYTLMRNTYYSFGENWMC